MTESWYIVVDHSCCQYNCNGKCDVFCDGKYRMCCTENCPLCIIYKKDLLKENRGDY